MLRYRTFRPDASTFFASDDDVADGVGEAADAIGDRDHRCSARRHGVSLSRYRAGQRRRTALDLGRPTTSSVKVTARNVALVYFLHDFGSSAATIGSRMKARMLRFNDLRGWQAPWTTGGMTAPWLIISAAAILTLPRVRAECELAGPGAEVPVVCGRRLGHGCREGP